MSICHSVGLRTIGSFRRRCDWGWWSRGLVASLPCQRLGAGCRRAAAAGSASRGSGGRVCGELRMPVPRLAAVAEGCWRPVWKLASTRAHTVALVLGGDGHALTPPGLPGTLSATAPRASRFTRVTYAQEWL